jgi:hypothetical protein
MEAAPDVPTAFEEEVQRLGLNEQTCATSEKLKHWCDRNKERCYIPESSLKRWGIQVGSECQRLRKHSSEGFERYGLVTCAERRAA